MLRGEGLAPDAEVVAGLRVTGHFLENHLAPELGTKPLPEARARLVRQIEKRLGEAAPTQAG